MVKPVLITLTSPTCSGKSHLLNYIRDEAGLACLASTTTRPQRAGEINGKDYYFITHEESKRMEEAGEFAELAHYGGNRYGVTKKEFHEKLSTGMAFLIVQPVGMEDYVHCALEMGAMHVKYFVDCPEEIRIARFTERVTNDVKLASTIGSKLERVKTIDKLVNTHMTRFHTMITHESKWKDLHEWDMVLDGTEHPAKNLVRIIADVNRRQNKA